jgi:Leucine-rich repeat (LRR) protein
MPDADPATTETRRFSMRLPRPLWFGLSTVAVVVVGLGWRVAVPIYRQFVAIREIERLYGVVRTEPRGPKWLRASLTDKRMKVFDDVIGVHFIVGRATDSTVGHLGCLTKVEVLELEKTEVTDEGLAQIKGLTNLRKLHLSNTRVTDAGLAHLKGLTGLELIQLDNTQVTDAGLSHLKGMTRLTDLNLEETQITDLGLSHLKALISMRRLDLDGTLVSDVGLAHLKNLADLRELSLQNTRVTDAGLSHLKNLSNLRRLDILGNGKVTGKACWKLMGELPGLVVY